MNKHNEKHIIREQPATYEDYAQLPDNQRYELADGVLELMSPAPSPRHQAISYHIQSLLTQSCHSEYIILASPIDLILSHTEVRQPDLVMIHRSRIGIITQRGIEGNPDLVAEILSPHSAKRDKYSKRKVYAKYGIPEYWIIDIANESLDQYILSGDDYVLHNVYDREEIISSQRLPCVSFTIAQIHEATADIPG